MRLPPADISRVRAFGELSGRRLLPSGLGKPSQLVAVLERRVKSLFLYEVAGRADRPDE
jgi:hypothetical protein